MTCQWRKVSAVVQNRVFDRIYMFRLTIFTNDYIHAVKANCIFLSKRLWYIFVYLP